MNDARIAAAFTELMSRLGYDRYCVQGGDAGARIAPEMDRLEPERVIGVHLNALVTFPSGDPAEMAELTDAERRRLGRLQATALPTARASSASAAPRVARLGGARFPCASASRRDRWSRDRSARGAAAKLLS